MLLKFLQKEQAAIAAPQKSPQQSQLHKRSVLVETAQQTYPYSSRARNNRSKLPLKSAWPARLIGLLGIIGLAGLIWLIDRSPTLPRSFHLV